MLGGPYLGRLKSRSSYREIVSTNLRPRSSSSAPDSGSPGVLPTPCHQVHPQSKNRTSNLKIEHPNNLIIKQLAS